MKSSAKTLTLIVGAALFLAAFVWLLATRGPLAPVGVQSGDVVRADLNPGIFGIGTVEARLAYAIGPTQPGRVLRVLVDQGDAVKIGALLAEMDPVDMDKRTQAAHSAAARSRQAMQAAQAQVVEAESRVKLAEANRARYLALYRKNFVAREMLDTRSYEAASAEAALVAMRANAQAASRDIGRADAELQGLERQRDSLRLASPVNGVVTAREAEPGTTVVAGQAVLRLVDPASLWVRARIDQSRALGVRVGQPASIVLRSAPGRTMPGRVARIELQSDAVTEERIVDVAFDPPPTRLYLGELAEVTIQLPGVAGALTVPSAAIARMNNQTGVWREVDGRARFKPVRIGSQSQDGLTQVLSGLTQGEKVIVYSAKQLSDGVRVREQKLTPS
ncbi:MAG TPA: efflux RND transporter periplasmic adaptor subunit [Sulfuriferula sp.]|nr:efflux RND transporter periplasmic adaptor subunit [Sulfuriferula sp.]